MGSPELKGKVTLLDDVRETIGAALKAQKLSLNSKEPKEILKAKELLMKAREDVKAFNSETRSSLINGEMSVAHAYSTDALQARKATGGKIDFIIPEEGATLWIDNLAIPVNAPHIKEAYQFIDFLLEPKVAASTVLSIFVAPSNKEVMSLLPAEYQQNTSLFPNDSTLSKLEMMQDLGDAMVNYDRTWTEVKAGGQ